MVSAVRCLAGAALAALAMYWFDPTNGRRRRARLRDRLTSRVHGVRDMLDVGSRDLTHRMRGLVVRMVSAFDEGTADDSTIAERVRACLGRVVSHPGAIDVSVSDGHVTLGGTVLAHEYRQLMRAVQSVRGVLRVEDRLGIHTEPDGIPALQGGRPRRPRSFELMQENWSPAARLLAGIAGGALVLHGLRRHDALGTFGTVAGSLFLARSSANMPLKRLAGGTGRRAIDIRKTFHVNAPVDQVFRTMAHFEGFPLFTRNVRNVRMHPDGRSHWSVAGPAGTSLEWDVVTTKLEPEKVVAWRTVPNAMIRHAGIIRLRPENGRTRVDIQMSYNPPAGALGHVIAKMLGMDPKTLLDQDMLRLKSFIETGKQPRDAAARGMARHLAVQA